MGQSRGGRTIVRPTGVVDPEITINRKGQIDDLIEARKRVDPGERVLVTTLTKRTAGS